MIGILRFLVIVFKLCSIGLPIFICYLEWKRYRIEKQEGKLSVVKKRIIIAVIVIAFTVAVLNVAQIYVGKKVVELTKKIAPRFDVYLANTDKGNQVIVFDAINYTPFEVLWTIVTEENKVVDGFMLSLEKIFFSKEKKRVYYKVSPDMDAIKNNYLELRVRYKSLYFDELNKLDALAGQIIKKYRYENNEFHPIDEL